MTRSRRCRWRGRRRRSTCCGAGTRRRPSPTTAAALHHLLPTRRRVPLRRVDVPPAGRRPPPPRATSAPRRSAEMRTGFPGLASHMEQDNPGMHTTDTIDFEVVLSGEIVARARRRCRVVLHPGDTVVQNGTRHRWSNPGVEPATLAVFILRRTSPARSPARADPTRVHPFLARSAAHGAVNRKDFGTPDAPHPFLARLGAICAPNRANSGRVRILGLGSGGQSSPRRPGGRPGPACGPCRGSRRREMRVVHRVAEQLLALARHRAHDVGRRRQVVVLLGAQPAEAVAQVRAAAGDRRWWFAPPRVDRAAEVDDGRAGASRRTRSVGGRRSITCSVATAVRSGQRWLPGTTRVAPLSRVKSTNAITDASWSSGCGRGTSLHTASSRCSHCSSEPGPRCSRWPRFSW